MVFRRLIIVQNPVVQNQKLAKTCYTTTSITSITSIITSIINSINSIIHTSITARILEFNGFISFTLLKQSFPKTAIAGLEGKSQVQSYCPGGVCMCIQVSHYTIFFITTCHTQ